MMMLEVGSPPPKVRVFIADDLDVIIPTLATILNLAGYDACAIYGGDAAARLLNLLHPEVLVVDVTTPGSTGIPVRPSIAAMEISRCKVLLFSSPTDLYSLLQNDQEIGPSLEILTWPIQPEDLFAKLRHSLCSAHPPLLVPIELGEANLH